jgi:hypothetical protein
MNHFKIASALLLTTLAQTKAAVVFSQLDFGTDSITVHNNGASIVDLSGWRFCSHDFDENFTYSNSSALNGQTIAAGQSLTIDLSGINFVGSIDNTNSLAVGLYNNLDGSLSFGSSNDLSAYLQYSPIGATDAGNAETRTVTAVAAGLWDAPGSFFRVAPSSSGIFLNDLNTSTGASSFSTVPEPSTGLLAGLGFLNRRKRA